MLICGNCFDFDLRLSLELWNYCWVLLIYGNFFDFSLEVFNSCFLGFFRSNFDFDLCLKLCNFCCFLLICGNCFDFDLSLSLEFCNYF